VILILVATLASTTFTSATIVLTLAVVVLYEFDAFFPWNIFFISTNIRSSYAHLNHKCDKHTNYSSDPSEVD
jgi:hypothetical protein